MNTTGIPQTIKDMISVSDLESLDLLACSSTLSLDLRKIIETRPLTSEQILKDHGIDFVLLYTEICNESDYIKVKDEELQHIVNIK